MITDISEATLILLFTKGLVEPLRSLVKAYRPTTLQEVVRRTRELQDKIPRIKYHPIPVMPLKLWNQRPPMRNFPSPGKKYYSYKDWDELRRKQLFFPAKNLGFQATIL